MASESKKMKLNEEETPVDCCSGESEATNNVEEKVSLKVIEFNEKRVRVLKENKSYQSGECSGVVYWMARDQRVQNNWAMIYAQNLALKHKRPLHVVFCLPPNYPHPTRRRIDFLFNGLKEVEEECRSLNITFHMLPGEASVVLPTFLVDNTCGCLVADMSPLKFYREQVDALEKTLDDKISFYHVDAHNVVPVWETSEKQEYAARTIRPKIHNKLDEFLTDFPLVTKHPHDAKKDFEKVDWDAMEKKLDIVESVKAAAKFTPGTTGGMKAANHFIETGLRNFAELRNNPNADEGVSNLSPWFNFGQISAQKVILIARKSKNSSVSFVEELLVRKELSDNFCWYNENHDNIKGTVGWAQETLETHKSDERKWVYDLKQLEEGKTHDDLWNAAQIQMVHQGKMHGFLRMYWAKKILEWTETPEKALEYTMYLNDQYELDGNDPNGIVGAMWSICGIHDTAWTEREVFGKVRYMNYKGCQRKFDVPQFVLKYKKVASMAEAK